MMTRPLLHALLLTSIALSGGCAIGALGYAFVPPTIEPAYVLLDQSTVVLVDDVAGNLGDTQLPLDVAARASVNLTDNLAFKNGLVIEPRHVVQLMQTMSREEYLKLPVDEVGRRLGVAQVIHVHIDSAIMIPEAGLWKPTARAKVKVIDVATGKRLFPSDDVTDGAEAGDPRSRGIVITELQPRPATAIEADAVPAIRKVLADRLGRDVARLFHGWTVDRTPGAKFRD